MRLECISKEASDRLALSEEEHNAASAKWVATLQTDVINSITLSLLANVSNPVEYADENANSFRTIANGPGGAKVEVAALWAAAHQVASELSEAKTKGDMASTRCDELCLQLKAAHAETSSIQSFLDNTSDALEAARNQCAHLAGRLGDAQEAQAVADDALAVAIAENAQLRAETIESFQVSN